MTEPLLLDPEWRRWLPGFSEAVAAGRDLPVTAAAALVLALASGAADALTGRVISARDDLDELVAAAEEIRERELLVPRVTQILPSRLPQDRPALAGSRCGSLSSSNPFP